MYNGPTNEQLLESANMWTQRAEEHIRAADFCHAQATRFLARIAVEETERPKLVLLEGGLYDNNAQLG